MKSITVTFDAAGNPRVETSGFQGEACLEATADLVRALGGAATTASKDEMYEQEQTTTKVQTA